VAWEEYVDVIHEWYQEREGADETELSEGCEKS